jgi:hypothetical protein
MARMSMAEKLAGAVQPLDVAPNDGTVDVEQTPLRLVEGDGAAKSSPTEPAAAAQEPAPTVTADPEPATTTDAGNERPARGSSRRTGTSRKPRVQQTSAPQKPAAAAETEIATAAMQIEIEPELDARLVAHRQSTRTAFHHIILDAVERTYPQLTELVARALGRESEEPSPATASMFDRVVSAAPITTEGRKDRALHTIRTTLSNRALLDKIASDVGAPSRNFMISVALDAYLPKA